jgi:hypothetical protein
MMMMVMMMMIFKGYQEVGGRRVTFSICPSTQHRSYCIERVNKWPNSMTDI